MRKLLLLLLLLPCAVPGLAQLSPTTDAHTDTTHYRYNRAVQDPVFVFRSGRGQFTAQLPSGASALFLWQQLDTSSTATTLYTTLLADTLTLKSSSTTPATLGWGYYRVLIDTLDNLSQRHPADTLQAWVLLDSFVIDTIEIRLSLNPCENPGLSALMYPNKYDPNFGYKYYDLSRSQTIAVKLGALSDFKTFIAQDPTLNNCLQRQTEIDTLRWSITCEIPAHDVLRQVIDGTSISPDSLSITGWYSLLMPEGGQYIKSIAGGGVKWTPSTDIHQGATDIQVDQGWVNYLNTQVPTPLHNATYKLEVRNYFDNTATATSDTIYAKATFGLMDLTTGRGSSGNIAWNTSPETDQAKEHDAPLWVKVMNKSINAGAGSQFEWTFYESETERDTTLVPPVRTVRWQTLSTNPTEQVATSWAYLPGIYPIQLLVTNPHGCTDTAKFMLHVREFLIADDNFTTVLSPNSQKGNTHFKIKNLDEVHSVTAFEVTVVNRWNQLMYSSRSLDFAWDGKMRNTNSYAPDGVYFFVVKAEGHNNHGQRLRQTIKGNIHVFTGQ